MPTSVEKIRALSSDLPTLLAQLPLPPLAQPMVAMALPMVEPQVEAFLARGPDEVDLMLERTAAALLTLRSDAEEAPRDLPG